jgi:hypothetical protein
MYNSNIHMEYSVWYDIPELLFFSWFPGWMVAVNKEAAEARVLTG